MTSNSAGLSPGAGDVAGTLVGSRLQVATSLDPSSSQHQTFSNQRLRFIPYIPPPSMLCQRCANSLRGSRLAVLPKRAIRQASSSPTLLRRPGHPSTSTTPRAPRSIARLPAAALRAGALRPYSSSAPPDTSATAAESTSPSSSTLEKPDFLNEAESEVWDRLAKEFSPVELVVQDISGGCGSMYGIEISSDKFRGANMLKQQRMVNAVLGDLMKTWHGVQLKTRVP